jgi:murein DD-endopeptidase MepM/ murein hydrolase activator NlpD
MRSFIETCRLWLCWRPSSTGNHRARLWDRGSDPGGGCSTPARERSKPYFLRRDLPTAGLLLALLLVFLPITPAGADGRVFGPLAPHERGLQVDSALFSPQDALRFDFAGVPGSQGSSTEPGRPTGQTYVVQPGDTLSQIASRFHLNPAALASRNGLNNPDHIEVGQSLKLDLPDASLPLPLDQMSRAGAKAPFRAGGGDLLRVQVWPWPPVQGKTLAVWLEARSPISLTLGLDGMPYPVIRQPAPLALPAPPVPAAPFGPGDRRGWALVPIPALITPGDHSLIVSAGSTSIAITLPIEAGKFDLYHIPAAVSRPILNQAQKVQAEAARLKVVTGSRSATGWTPRSRFRSPLAGDYPRSSPFGSRRTYEPNPAVSAHEGEDFSVPAGTAVTAPAQGIVVLAEPLFVRGNAVVLDHGSGVFTGYWHLQELAVRRGDRVEPGQLLGRVGSTGLSTGAHLHWELRVNGVAVDPLQWLEK